MLINLWTKASLVFKQTEKRIEDEKYSCIVNEFIDTIHCSCDIISRELITVTSVVPWPSRELKKRRARLNAVKNAVNARNSVM